MTTIGPGRTSSARPRVTCALRLERSGTGVDPNRQSRQRNVSSVIMRDGNYAERNAAPNQLVLC